MEKDKVRGFGRGCMIAAYSIGFTSCGGTNSIDARQLEVTASELQAAFAENPHTAKIKYEKKDIIVSGTIQTKGSDIKGNPIATFITNDQLRPIQAQFAARSAVAVGELQSGYQARIICKNVTFAVSFIYLDNCQIAQSPAK